MPITREDLGQRLAAARQQRGWKQADLAEAVGLTQSAVSRIESGERSVESVELARLAEALRVSVLELLGDDTASEIRLAARAESVRDRTALDTALAYVDRLLAANRILSELGFGNSPAARLETPVQLSRDAAKDGARLARWFRDSHDLGEEPIHDMTEVAEACAGLGVALYPIPDGVAGLCVHSDGFALTLIDSSAVVGRQRFTTAHELYHHLAGDPRPIHIDEELFGKGLPEVRANAFATHLLMPETAIKRRVGKSPVTDGVLVDLQYAFGVSLDALCWHLVNLGLITKRTRENALRAGAKALAFRHGFIGHWRDWESLRGDTLPPSRLLRRTLDAYAAGQIGIRRVADLLGVTEPEKLRQELEDAGIGPGGWPDDTAPA